MGQVHGLMPGVPPGGVAFEVEHSGGCSGQNCGNRTWDDRMAKPSIMATWTSQQWAAFAAEMGTLIRSYHRDGRAHYALLLLPIGVILTFVGLIAEDSEVSKISRLSFPFMIIALVIFFSLLLPMRSANERIDRQITDLCNRHSDAIVQLQWVTQWTGVCKPKHARTYRALHIVPTQAMHSMGMPPAVIGGVPIGAQPVMGQQQGGMVAHGVPVQPTMQTMEIACPPGVSAGSVVQIMTPSGPMQVTVPPGVASGMTFQVQIPATPVVTAVAVAA